MKENWQNCSFLLLFFGIPFLFLFSPAYLIQDPVWKMIAAMVTMPLYLLCSVLIPCGIRHGKSMFEELGLRSPGLRDYVAAFLMIPLFFCFAVFALIAKQLGVPVGPQMIAEFGVNCPDFAFFAVLLCAGVLSPIAEELAFRKVICGELMELLPWKGAAAVLTSFFFAVSHGLIWQSVSLFFFGLILQWQSRKGSLSRAILMHAALNWCSLIILIMGRSGLFPEMIVEG